MAFLEALHGANPGQCFPLEGESAILGRHPDCDIVLELGAVSRQHARVLQLDGGYYVEDLGSRNGTFVGGELVTERRLLHDGDQLTICELTFVFHLDVPAAASATQDAEPAEQEPDTVALMIDDLGKPLNSSTITSKVDVSTGSTALQIEVNTEAKLRALIEIGRGLGRALALNEVLSNLLDTLFGIFVQADRGFVVLQDRGTRRLVPKAVKYRQLDDTETIRISRTIVAHVMAEKEAILSADATDDDRFDMAESIVDFHIRSMMCAPMIGSDGETLGVIQIDTLDQRSRFSREDLDVLAGVACQAAIAVENAELHEAALRQQAVARELALAHEVQRRLLPAASPQLEQYEFFEFYEPANELGGDYYDYVQLPDGRLAVVVADVSGKGISASLLMAKLSAETRFCLATAPSPAEAISRLNQVFCGSGWDDRFVTMVTCVLDPLRHEVTIVNAGHMPPLLRSPSAKISAVAEEQTRLPLGVKDDVDYPQLTVPLAPGETLTLYTDGITEAMNDADQLYGNERLLARLAGKADRVQAIGQGILDDVKQFVGARSQSDDMCLACFGRGQ